MGQKRERGWKYDFPSRVLSRAEKFLRSLLERRGIGPGSARYPEIFQAGLNLVQELVLIRLFEENWLLEAGWLGGWMERGDEEGFFQELAEFNRILGIEAFLPELSLKLGINISELRDFIKELYSSSIFPRGVPPEVLGAILERAGWTKAWAGTFFTPGWLVRLMVEESFQYLDWEGRLEDKRFFILDPAFGSGNFLLCLLRKMIKSEEEYYARRPSGLFYPLMRLGDLSRSIEVELRLKLAEEHLFGLELNGFARRSAVRALVVELVRGKSIYELEPGSLGFLERNLALGDYLIDQPLRTQPGLFEQGVWELEPFDFQSPSFPHHQAILNQGFDLIIGNPPWLSLKGKHKKFFYPPEVVDWLIERYQADSYRPNLFEIFIRRSLELIKEEGINCFLVPDRLAENLQFQPLRELLVSRGEVLRLHFREPFPGVVSDTLIYWFRKKSSPRGRKILVSEPGGKEKEITTRQFVRSRGLEKELLPARAELLEKIRKSCRAKLSDYFTCGVGLIARKGTITEEKVNPNQQEIIKGENVLPYKVEGHFYFEFHPHNLLGGTVRYSKLTAGERILVRKTGNKLTSALDRSGFLVEQSVYYLIPKKAKRRGYALEYFLALLNSSLLNFYYRHFLITNPKSTPQLKKFHLEQLPVKRIKLKDEREKELYEKIIELAQARMEEFEPSRQKELEKELDDLIFTLYQLTSQEQALVRGKPGK